MTVQQARSKQPGGSWEARRPWVDGPMHDAVRLGDRHPGPLDAVEDTGADQRSAARFTLLIRSAKVIAPDAEFLCVVRDASASGISVRLFHPLPADVPLTLEFPNGDRHLLERVWEEADKAGFRFADMTDLARLIEGPSPFSRRPLRVNLDVPCEILASLRRVGGTLRNLSQQGALIATTEHLSLVQRVKLSAPGLPEVAAKVRWRRGDQYGLSFEDNLQFGDLALIVHDLQRRAER